MTKTNSILSKNTISIKLFISLSKELLRKFYPKKQSIYHEKKVPYSYRFAYFAAFCSL